jgi:hypothetical protein
MGAVTFETRSGTNAIHGNLFENLRNSILDANGFFNNATGKARGVLKQHDFGATAGGPVYLPKIYDGRNRTFFFASYQGFRNRAGIANPSYMTIPTPANWQGDFSTWTRNGKFVQIYDPASTRPNPSGAGYIRDPFPGNKIASSRFDPVAMNFLKYMPKGFVPNTNPFARAPDAMAELRPVRRLQREPWNKGSLRADHQINSANRFTYLYLEGRQADQFGPDGPTGIPAPLNGAAVVTRFNRSQRLAW